jgi:hypothetical protein
MSSTDRSNTERIRQLRARLLAASIAKGTYKTNDGETWLTVKVGREGRIINPAGGAPALSVPGCCNCNPVCDLSGDTVALPYSYFDASDILLLQDEINANIIGSVFIPFPPVDYPNNYFIVIFYFNGCNTTNISTVMYDNSGAPIDASQFYLGMYPTTPSGSFNIFDTVGFTIIYPTEVIAFFDDIGNIEITASNACSSVTDNAPLGCFLPGTPVALSGGRTKAIEDVVVGDRVIGAFGEENPVIALHRPFLGAGKVCRLNDEHTTTTHHPHIGAERGFYCPDPAALNNFTYGQKHTVILGDGTKEKRVMTGVRRDRILKLKEGTVLQTLTGPRTVTKMEPVAMSPFTQVYHLVVGGSHTYTVDGYAVVGWAREDDWDYDSWTARSN